MPGFEGVLGFVHHRSKPDKITFSERQRLRKSGVKVDQDLNDDEYLGGLPAFRQHRTKPDKITFSERQRLRKAAAIQEEGSVTNLGHRTKNHLTFSERQRLRRKQRLQFEFTEKETLDLIDGMFADSWVSGSPSSKGLAMGEEWKEEEEAVKETEQSSAEPIKERTSVGSGTFGWRLGPVSKRLLSGAIAGGVSRTAVAPLETIRTHLMVGNDGKKGIVEVFKWIMAEEGWKGLYRGNGLNVLRVAPAKAIELYTYDTVKKAITPKDGSPSRIPVPISSIAGASAGIASCLVTYPLELVKTRLTVQPGDYKGVIDAFCTIASVEGFGELYRGLVPSVLGVIPYAGANYFAYDSLRTLYRKVTKEERIGNLATLLIGSTAGAFASTATFPLEVARKQMQVGALSGRVVYKGTFDALQAIYRSQGIGGLYRGLVPSCVKLMPAAGISFMCYEALKTMMIEEQKLEKKAE